MLDEKEYERLHNKLEYNLGTRNSLLTFSFTTVLTILGLAIATEIERISVLLYLIPFCILIPFTARIVYYRLIHAHINAFLMVYAPDKMQFQVNSAIVPEEQSKVYLIIAFLNNFETSILATACSIIFYIKYIPKIDTIKFADCLLILVPVLLTGIIIGITTYGFNYKKHLEKYKTMWRALLNNQNNKENSI